MTCRRRVRWPGHRSKSRPPPAELAEVAPLGPAAAVMSLPTLFAGSSLIRVLSPTSRPAFGSMSSVVQAGSSIRLRSFLELLLRQSVQYISYRRPLDHH